MGALGDLVMSTSLIRGLMQHHQADTIWLLTSPGFAPMFEGWEGLNIKALPRKGLHAMVQTLLWIRRNHFRRIYDLQSSERTALVCLLSGVTDRVGNHPGPAYTHHPHDRYNGKYHAIERLNEVLGSGGVPPCLDPPFLPVNGSSIIRIRSWLTDAGLAEKSFVLMHAGASLKHPLKRWPYFLDLALQLKAAGLQTLWLGGKEDREINDLLSSNIGINTTGLFNIQEEAELGRHARFAVTNDSAPMHILSCSGIPVFGLFGPTDWRRTHAVGQKNFVIAVDDSTRAGPDYKFVPHNLANLSVTKVMDKIRQSGILASDS